MLMSRGFAISPLSKRNCSLQRRYGEDSRLPELFLLLHALVQCPCMVAAHAYTLAEFKRRLANAPSFFFLRLLRQCCVCIFMILWVLSPHLAPRTKMSWCSGRTYCLCLPCFVRRAACKRLFLSLSQYAFCLFNLFVFVPPFRLVHSPMCTKTRMKSCSLYESKKHYRRKFYLLRRRPRSWIGACTWNIFPAVFPLFSNQRSGREGDIPFSLVIRDSASLSVGPVRARFGDRWIPSPSSLQVT